MLRRLSIIFGYLVAAAVIIGGTALLVAYGNGYSYDLKSGQLKHKGLVILESLPSGAKILVDGREIKQKTPYRNTFEGGSHDFVVSKDGYRTWHKSVPVTPAQVSLAQYVILIPQHIQADAVINRVSINQFVATRDHRRAGYVVPSGTEAGVWWVDTNSRAQTKAYVSQPASEGVPAETVQLLSWSDDNSHMLIKSQVGEAISYIVIGSNGTDTPINLSQTFKQDLAGLTFSLSNWREMYWLDNGALKRLDSGSLTATSALAEHVLAYAYAGDRLVYVDGSKQVRALWSIDRGGRKQELVSSLPASDHYGLDYATYIGTPEVAVVNLDAHTLTLYSDVFSKKVSKVNVPGSFDSAKFNGDGRFLISTGSSGVATYDVERSQIYKFTDINNGATGVSWFDNYHVLLNRGGSIVLAEFDGNYSIVLTKATGLPAFNSADGKSVITVGTTSAGESQIRDIIIRK